MIQHRSRVRALVNATGTGVPLCLFLLAFQTLPGCSSPLTSSPDDDLRRSIIDSVKREQIDAARLPQKRTLERHPRTESLEIKPEVMRQLEAASGPDSYRASDVDYGPNLMGEPQDSVSVSLETAVATALTNNLSIQFAQVAPAISSAQVVASQAAFDWVFFVNSQWNRTDEPQTVNRVGTTTFGVPFVQRQALDATTGLRRRLTSGGQFTLQTQSTYTDNETAGQDTSPDPASAAAVVLQLDQPLLRNFGSDVALGQVRLNVNAERDQIQALKGEMLGRLADTEEAYWRLVQAHQDLRILTRLLDRGIEVRDKLKSRLIFDVEPAQFSDAVATVESRRADVLRARNVLRQSSDQLKSLVNHPELTVGGETLILPADEAVDQPIEFSKADVFTTAIRNRPEVQRALISIDDTSIRQQLADNARLPLLDLRAQARFNALERNLGNAYDRLTDANFVDFLLGLNFEQPVGNREAEANFRVRRLQQNQSVIAYRNTVQGVLLEVTRQLRDVYTNFDLIEQTRAARVAAAENLRTLEVKEKTLQGLTPEFLDLKLRRQQELAAREQEEIGALINYNIALARLHQAMGTLLERNNIQFKVPDAEDLSRLSPETTSPVSADRPGSGDDAAAPAQPAPAQPADGEMRPIDGPPGGRP